MTRVRSSTAALLLAASVSCAAPRPAPAPATAATAAATGPSATTATPATSATAQPAGTPDEEFRKQPPAPGPEPQFRVPAFKRFHLKGGLEVILAEAHELPLVSFNLIVKTGGAANPAAKPGLAELTANMLDEGTTSRSALAIAEELAQLGTSLAAGSNADASQVTMSALTKTLDRALAVFADVVVNPSFAEAELQRVRNIVRTAVARRKDSPPSISILALFRVLYGDRHPYAWPNAGIEESLDRITLADVRKFHETYYRPNNSTLIVVGDVTEAEVRAKLEPLLKGWKARRVPAQKVPAPAPPPATRVYLIDKAGAPQSSIRIGTVALERTSPDYHAATLMNLILGGGFYRLDLNLREGKGWTYGARSTLDTRRTPGPLSAGGEFIAAHTADSVAEIVNEIRLLREGEVTDAELSRAKDQIVKSFPSRFATRAAFAQQLAELAIYDLPDSALRDYTKKIMAVGKDDIRRVARRLLDPSRLAVVVVGDQKSLQDPLAKLAPVEPRDLEGAPLPAPAPPATAASGASAPKPTTP